MKEQHFETALPSGYQAVFHINANNKKMGILLNVIAIVIWAVTLVSALWILMPQPPSYTLPVPLC